jgi:hypothetical protein
MKLSSNKRLFLKYIFKTLVAIMFLGFCFVGFGQQTKQVTHQNLLWYRYVAQLKLAKKLSLQQELENRNFVEEFQQHQFICHTRLHVQVKKNVEVAAGFTYSRQSSNNQPKANSLVIPELRPVQEITFTKVFSPKFSLLQRVRLDERFFRNTEGASLVEGYNFTLRARYRILAKYNVKPALNLKLSNEIMLQESQTNPHLFDQNRIVLAAEYKLTNHFTLEPSYTYWYQQRLNDNAFFQRNIFRISLIHAW